MRRIEVPIRGFSILAAALVVLETIFLLSGLLARDFWDGIIKLPSQHLPGFFLTKKIHLFEMGTLSVLAPRINIRFPLAI